MPKRRICLLTWGSHGDLVPFVALGIALQQAGHQVTLGAQPAHAGFVRRYGIEFHAVGRKISQQNYLRLMDAMLAQPNPRKQLRLLLQETLLPDLDRQYADCVTTLRDADLVVAHWMQIAGSTAAEATGKPYATVTLNPVGISCLAEAVEPPPARAASRDASANIGRLLSDFLWGDSVHRLRRDLGLPPVQSVSDCQYSKQLNLVAVSRQLLGDQPGWGAQHQVTGFWHLDAASEWRPPAALQEFLAAGPKPVVITLGSMAWDAQATSEIVADAVSRVGCRTIVQGGWAGLGSARTGANVLLVDYVPHEYLFRHAACIVHHGGAGTTAAALRMGVPSVILWHMLDQPYWGNLLEKMQLGPKPLQRLGVTPEALAERITEVLTESAYGSRCTAVSRQMANEPGVNAAASAISAMAEAQQSLPGRRTAP